MAASCHDRLLLRSAGLRLEDPANVGIGALGRVESAAALHQLLDLIFEHGELTASAAYFFEFGGKKRVDVAAWGGAAVAQFDDTLHLCQCETGRLRTANESQPVEGGRVVHPIAVGSSTRRRKQAPALVVADGARRNTRGTRNFSNQHRHRLVLDLLLWEKVYRRLMDVTLMYFDDCPNWQVANERLRQLADEIDDVELTTLQINTPEDAEQHGFRGSPSILINGSDPFARPDDPVGLSCRVYQTPEGPSGSPTISQLREVLQRDW